VKHRPPLIDIVCCNCQEDILASEAEGGSWEIKIRVKTDGKWRTVTEWQDDSCAPNSKCRAEGYVETFALSPSVGHGRIRGRQRGLDERQIRALVKALRGCGRSTL
jgi:hypothetical protein